jgi:lipid-A-disaccharide synthase
MQAAGVELYADLTDLAVIGFFEVLKNLKKIKAIFRILLKKTDEAHPSLAILVDYPGFNLRLAAELKKRQIPVVYYISPQVWAWGRKRIKVIKKLVKRMVVFFEFEKELYEKTGVPVYCVGHPLLDLVKPKLDKAQLLRRLQLLESKYTVAILPGSRIGEVKTHLPIMLRAATIIKEKLNDAQFLILRSSNVKDDVFKEILAGFPLPVHLLTNQTYDCLAASDFALVASGTATLETAILGIPMAIIYKLSFLSWLYLKRAVKIPFIGLVNIVAGKKIVPEFIQYNARPEKIADYAIKLLTQPEDSQIIKKLLGNVKNALGEKGAATRAAQIILECLNGDRHR